MSFASFWWLCFCRPLVGPLLCRHARVTQKGDITLISLPARVAFALPVSGVIGQFNENVHRMPPRVVFLLFCCFLVFFVFVLRFPMDEL